MANFTVEVRNEEILKAFDRLNKRLTNMKPILDKVSAEMFTDVQDHFSKEVGPKNSKWPELSDKTLARRRKEGKGAKILQDTGRLKNSFSHSANKTSAVLINDATNKGDLYGAKHNFGLGRMPKREFMYLSDKAERNIISMMLDEIEDSW